MISLAGILVADLIVRPICGLAGQAKSLTPIAVLLARDVANAGVAVVRLDAPASALAAIDAHGDGRINKHFAGMWAVSVLSEIAYRSIAMSVRNST